MELYPRQGPPPTETLALLMKMRTALGVTRVADITGLDRIGFPVVQVTRPFSFSNSVAQGKGTDTARAAVSALMEAAETFFAERIDRFTTAIASGKSLDIPLGRFDAHVRAPARADWHSSITRWTAAENLMNDSEVWVPSEMVHTAYIEPQSPHDGLFWATSTGLAAAFHETDAIIHGVLECVERDALARAHKTHGFLHRQRIDTSTITDSTVAKLLERLSEKGLLPGLWLAPSPTGIPVISCHLLEANPRETALLHLPTEGSAAAFDPAAAAQHAIYEALQARLAVISGARDDITRAFYPKYPDWQLIEAHQRLIRDGPRTINFGDLVERAATLPDLLAELERSGIDAVYVVHLDTSPLIELSAVRVIIPQLQPLLAA